MITCTCLMLVCSNMRNIIYVNIMRQTWQTYGRFYYVWSCCKTSTWKLCWQAPRLLTSVSSLHLWLLPGTKKQYRIWHEPRLHRDTTYHLTHELYYKHSVITVAMWSREGSGHEGWKASMSEVGRSTLWQQTDRYPDHFYFSWNMLEASKGWGMGVGFAVW